MARVTVARTHMDKTDTDQDSDQAKRANDCGDSNANRDSALEGTGARVDVSSQSTRNSLQRANDSSLHSTKAVRSTQPSGSQQRVGCGTRGVSSGGPNTRSRVQSSNNSLGVEKGQRRLTDDFSGGTRQRNTKQATHGRDSLESPVWK
ncbi:hypothetical protein BaRGS_00000535 [Batillaria attramentaria]|uniref:Uncharacterized protein n=1 Tax=Batillaria attramentaria TaxID=370345 RepID=A0ABD0MA97_9CAEN